MRPCRRCGEPIPNDMDRCPECEGQEEPRKAEPVRHIDDSDEKAEQQMFYGFIAAVVFLPSLILIPFFGWQGLYVGLAVTGLLFALFFLGPPPLW